MKVNNSSDVPIKDDAIVVKSASLYEMGAPKVTDALFEGVRADNECGQIDVDLSADRQAVTIMLFDFKVAVHATDAAEMAARRCNLKLMLRAPAGYAYTLGAIVYSGQSLLQKGMAASSRLPTASKGVGCFPPHQ